MNAGRKVRADALLCERGLAPSRAQAQALILAGEVHTQHARIEKPGHLLDGATELFVRGRSRYVSRGGDKLAGALTAHALDPSGKRCLDVGASTGGFTDCLLQHGAREVIAVDVGYGQLAEKLRQDPRVDNRERTNAKVLDATALGGAVEWIVVDASFIGLGKLATALFACLRPGGVLLALIKPQFEAGVEEARRSRGVIRDPAVRSAAIERALEGVRQVGFTIVGVSDCVITGPKGNLEAFVHAVKPEHELPSQSLAT